MKQSKTHQNEFKQKDYTESRNISILKEIREFRRWGIDQNEIESINVCLKFIDITWWKCFLSSLINFCCILTCTKFHLIQKYRYYNYFYYRNCFVSEWYTSLLTAKSWETQISPNLRNQLGSGKLTTIDIQFFYRSVIWNRARKNWKHVIPN